MQIDNNKQDNSSVVSTYTNKLKIILQWQCHTLLPPRIKLGILSLNFVWQEGKAGRLLFHGRDIKPV